MKKSPFRISSCVLRILSAIIALVFVLFFFIVYNMYFEEDSRFRSPLLTDALLVFIGLMLLGTLVVTIWSVVVTFYRRGAHAAIQTRQMPVSRLNLGITVFVLISAVLTWLFGSSEPMLVNGETFASPFWLRVADMFVGTCVVLTLASFLLVGYSSWQSLLKKRSRP